MLRRSVRSTNLDEHILHFQNARGKIISDEESKPPQREFAIPRPLLVQSTLPDKFKLDELKRPEKRVPTPRPTANNGGTTVFKSFNQDNWDNADRKGGLSKVFEETPLPLEKEVSCVSKLSGEQIAIDSTQPNNNGKKFDVPSREINSKVGRTRAVSANIQREQSSPKDESSFVQKPERLKPLENSQAMSRNPLDFDAYLSLCNLGSLYLVKHLGRGLFVKFTEKKLKVPANAYKKGKNMTEANKNEVKQLAEEVKKYYPKRYTLFSRYDEGIQLDTVGWFSVTPECVAKYTAERLNFPLVVDLFSGVGGNSIQFALQGSVVVAVDISKERVEISRHNAQVYGVSEYINFINSDVLELPASVKGDAVFISPPWGGTAYGDKEYYSLFREINPNMKKVVEKAMAISSKLCGNLPRNTIISELVVLFSIIVEEQRQRGLNIENKEVYFNPVLEIEKIYIGESLKCIQIYFGDFPEVGCVNKSLKGSFYSMVSSTILQKMLTSKMLRLKFYEHKSKEFWSSSSWKTSPISSLIFITKTQPQLLTSIFQQMTS